MYNGKGPIINSKYRENIQRKFSPPTFEIVAPSLNSQHYNKVQVKGSEIGESSDLLVNDGANLKF